MADEEVDLNPITSTVGNKRNRKKVVETAPNDGDLIIAAHYIVLKGDVEAIFLRKKLVNIVNSKYRWRVVSLQTPQRRRRR